MRMLSPHRKVGGLLILLLAIAVIALPDSAAAMGSEGRLSPRLAKLATPELRGASPDRQARALSLVSRGPGSLLRRGNRVLVYVRFDRGAVAATDDLRAAGAETVDASRRYQVDTVAAEPAQLPGLAAVPGVTSVQPAYTPIVAEASPPVAATTLYEPCFGAETSEGDAQLGAAKARAEFEVAGTGTKVGILSDSFDQDPLAPTGAAEDVRSGDLPGAKDPCGELTPVEVLDDTETEGEDEGRGMAQIVHDLAPGAAISFATAFTGEPEFAENIRALAANKASVIVDDVTYLEEPFFQEGPVGVAIGEVSENDNVAYYTAAGNNNSFDGSNEIGSWEAPEFRDSETCPSAVAALAVANPNLNTKHCMDFDPAPGLPDRTFGIAVEPGEELTIDLQWAEPWEGVHTDLDAYLLDENGKVVRSSTERNVASTHQPVEILGWENQSAATAVVRLVINKRSGGGSRPLKFILAQNGGGVAATEYEESSEGDVVGPTIFGHNGSEHAMSIGAIRQNTNSKPEFFSSRGPVTHYFEAATGDGSGPAAELSSPRVLSKPDVVASDGGADTFFGICSENAWRFFGTSAAAPHAAAVAALEREAAPAASAEEVEQAQREAALAVGAFPPAAVGSGLIDTPGTLEALGLTALDPGASVAEPPPPGPCTPPREPRKQSSGITPLPPTSPTPPEEPPKREPKPRTFFLQRPSKVIRTHHHQAKAVFRFGSNESEASFVCRVDGGFFRPCPARLARQFTLGWHVIKVAARSAAGNGDKTPASYSFKVKRVR